MDNCADHTYREMTEAAIAKGHSDIDADDNTMPARLRHPQKMLVETAEDRHAQQSSSAGMEMMPLAQNDMEYFDDEPQHDSTPTALYHRDEEPVVRSEIIPDWLEDFLFPPGLPRKGQLRGTYHANECRWTSRHEGDSTNVVTASLGLS